MKSEHRHELKTNELERIAHDWGRASERYIQQHTYQLVIAAALIVLAVIGVLYWKSASASSDTNAWRELANAGSAADFGNVADKYPGTRVGAWARLREGEAEYYSAVRLMFTDGDAGRSEMKKAQEDFEKLINDKTSPIDVVERAWFGLGRCREALPDKNVPLSKINDRAIETYERLLKSKDYEGTVYTNIADARVEALRKRSAQEFYAWFENQNPKPSDLERPKDQMVPPLRKPAEHGKSPDKTQSAPAATTGKKSAATESKKTAPEETKSSQSGPSLPLPPK